MTYVDVHIEVIIYLINYLTVQACQNLRLDAHDQSVLVHSLTQSIHMNNC